MNKKAVWLVPLWLLAGCAGAGYGEYTAGDLRGFNHSASEGINWFTVNGYGGRMTGNSCCVLLPRKWIPGMEALVEWEVDPNPRAIIPLKKEGFGYEEEAYARHAAQYRRHSAVVPVPEYGEQRCGMTVHFLPCNQVKVTTVCMGYGTPDYPIKEPLNMPEPENCPVATAVNSAVRNG
ncbi:DUF3304 domain-containing protein [Mangrovibacter plantisponsor]|uniref:Uncharacterized protein DUF3304 n=1 Tax=Mangrovibacter plantisponsor TaxID=451513 RepID=A0A317Q5P6_9ENTR|nr:DUF3304 domain-containing protein [Mangrovibacter plantisponsor]PWW10963.1 uncharacterized protein DUF3304 [Mangrovibacter plantisponsor]